MTNRTRDSGASSILKLIGITILDIWQWWDIPVLCPYVCAYCSVSSVCRHCGRGGDLIPWAVMVSVKESLSSCLCCHCLPESMLIDTNVHAVWMMSFHHGGLHLSASVRHLRKGSSCSKMSLWEGRQYPWCFQSGKERRYHTADTNSYAIAEV